MNIIQKYLLYKKLMNMRPTYVAENYGSFTCRCIDWICKNNKTSYAVQSKKLYTDETGIFYSTDVRLGGKTVVNFFDGYMSRKLFELAEKGLKKTR